MLTVVRNEDAGECGRTYKAYYFKVGVDEVLKRFCGGRWLLKGLPSDEKRGQSFEEESSLPDHVENHSEEDAGDEVI